MYCCMWIAKADDRSTRRIFLRMYTPLPGQWSDEQSQKWILDVFPGQLSSGHQTHVLIEVWAILNRNLVPNKTCWHQYSTTDSVTWGDILWAKLWQLTEWKKSWWSRLRSWQLFSGFRRYMYRARLLFLLAFFCILDHAAKLGLLWLVEGGVHYKCLIDRRMDRYGEQVIQPS